MRLVIAASAIALGLSLFGMQIPAALADEQMTPLAADGDWVAASHSDSMTDPPDVCIAFDENADFAFRVDNDDNEIRYGNDNWSLPANVSGTIDITVGTHNYALDIVDNTNTQVTAVITDDQLSAITTDMNTASSMTVKAGSGPATQVSLDGSNQVITAFLTCANKPQPGSTGGTNPFAGSSQ
jgi:hypothetical protein